MAEQTTNLGLTKPDAAEGYDVNVFNNNADAIDQFAGEMRNALGGSGGGLDDKLNTIISTLEWMKTATDRIGSGIDTTESSTLWGMMLKMQQTINTLLTQTKGVKAVHHLYATGTSNDGTLTVNLPAGVNKDRIAVIIAPRNPAAYTINADGTIKFLSSGGTPQVYYTIIEFY